MWSSQLGPNWSSPSLIFIRGISWGQWFWFCLKESSDFVFLPTDMLSKWIQYITYLTLAGAAVLFDTWTLWELSKLICGTDDATGRSAANLSVRRQYSFGGTLELDLPHIWIWAQLDIREHFHTLLLIGTRTNEPVNEYLGPCGAHQATQQQFSQDILLTNAWAQTGAHQANLQSAEW